MSSAPPPRPQTRPPVRSAVKTAPAGTPRPRQAQATARRSTPAPQRRSLADRFRPRLLPVTIFAAVLLLGTRVVDIWSVLTTGAAFPDVAGVVAETDTGAGAGVAAKPTGTVPATPSPVDSPAKTAPVASKPATGAPTALVPSPQPTPSIQNAGQNMDAAAVPPGFPEGFTPTDMEILQRLRERREELDQRALDLDQREALLQVAEQRIEQKIAELQTIKADIQKLVGQAGEQQQAQVESLVRIYETMKPKEAARIFEKLDNQILIDVLSRMKESKAAAVMAAMEPARAEQVTVLLHERRKLPEVPE